MKTEEQKVEEQEKVLQNDKKNMLVSASAGSGKTFIMIKYITELICTKRIPVKELVVLTFTKAAATEMKERLIRSLKEKGQDEFVVEQIDALTTANISTIDSFCEKCIKKYANLLGISENFDVVDERLGKIIKNKAFENALMQFEKEYPTEYLELMGYYKDNKNQIKTIIFEVENLVNSVADKNKFLSDNVNKAEEYFDMAVKYVFDSTKQKIVSELKELEKLHIDDFEWALKEALIPILDSKDLFEMAEKFETFVYPRIKSKKAIGEDNAKALDQLKIKKCKDFVKSLNVLDENLVNFQKSGKLEKMILQLFELYDKHQREIKILKNCLDFGDLEIYMNQLSEYENLFDGFKYVFVDEYQDTNKLQERIVKNIAKNCNFVAVGDVKQGIYGFRLASCDIFLQDMKNFEEEDDSQVRFLQSNFRSSQRVLNFVNEVFKICMTKDVAGIDYENGSMLQGRTPFLEENAKAINIDIVAEDEVEQQGLPTIYSVKNDACEIEQSNRKQLEAIRSRIFEVLNSKIYDKGAYRDCKYSDIAILLRKRGPLFNDIEMFLQESGIPVVSNSKNVLMDNVEIQVLLNMLKLALNFDDDIAVMSVLLSVFGGFKLEQIVSFKTQSDLKLCELVLENKNNVFENFLNTIEEFKTDIFVFGIKSAFLKLFDRFNYRAYINQKTGAQKENIFVDKFINEIVSSGLDCDLPGLINYFETVDISVTPEGDGILDAVLLATIHNSKGLEYPVVFLAGCDNSLSKAQKNGNVEINEEFGLAVKYVDTENNKEIPTIKLEAIKKIEEKKDFVEELMIFYVALTRARNRLYLFGKNKKNGFQKYSVQDCDSYFDLIFYALKKQYAEVCENEKYEDENLSIRLISQIESFDKIDEDSILEAFDEEKLTSRIREYLNFEYRFKDRENFQLKETVTSLSNKNLEEELQHYSNENISFGGAGVEIGNAYHLALKVLDFDKIVDEDSLLKELQINEEILADAIELVDNKILLRNILLLKSVVGGAKLFKEKEFILKESINNLLDGVDIDDKILLQGIVDLFAIKGDKAILIDYKYSNSTSDDYLKNKYKNQLKFYKIAIENAFNLKVEDIFLLSLKNYKLIKVNI